MGYGITELAFWFFINLTLQLAGLWGIFRIFTIFVAPSFKQILSIRKIIY